jgi:hypothetical protein
VLEGGVLFQGTVLIRNEIERFLRALRVPVEKLKKREIESLMQRLAFVDDLVGRPTDMAELKPSSGPDLWRKSWAWSSTRRARAAEEERRPG